MNKDDLMQCSNCEKRFKVIFIFTQGVPTYCPYCSKEIAYQYDSYIFDHHGEFDNG
jgi:uncharacterized Zn-finger protein